MRYAAQQELRPPRIMMSHLEASDVHHLRAGLPVSRSCPAHEGSPLTGLERATWPSGKANGVVGEPTVGQGVVGADELGTARESLVALSHVILA